MHALLTARVVRTVRGDARDPCLRPGLPDHPRAVRTRQLAGLQLGVQLQHLLRRHVHRPQFVQHLPLRVRGARSRTPDQLLLRAVLRAVAQHGLVTGADGRLTGRRVPVRRGLLAGRHGLARRHRLARDRAAHRPARHGLTRHGLTRHRLAGHRLRCALRHSGRLRGRRCAGAAGLRARQHRRGVVDAGGLTARGRGSTRDTRGLGRAGDTDGRTRQHRRDMVDPAGRGTARRLRSAGRTRGLGRTGSAGRGRRSGLARDSRCRRAPGTVRAQLGDELGGHVPARRGARGTGPGRRGRAARPCARRARGARRRRRGRATAPRAPRRLCLAGRGVGDVTGVRGQRPGRRHGGTRTGGRLGEFGAPPGPCG